MFDVDCSPIVLEFPVETGHIARDASVILQSKCNFNTASLQFKLLIFYIALPMHVPELVEMKSRRNNQPSYKMRYRMGVRLSSSTQSNRNQPKQIKNSKNHCKTSHHPHHFVSTYLEAALRSNGRVVALVLQDLNLPLPSFGLSNIKLSTQSKPNVFLVWHLI